MKYFFSLICLLFLIGCQSAVKTDLNLAKSEGTMLQKEMSGLPKGGMSFLIPWKGKISVAEEYQIGPGDKLQIEVVGQENLTGTYSVNYEGEIIFPLLDVVQVGGLTLPHLQTHLEGLLLKYLRSPAVKVYVVESATQRVVVFGAAGDFSADKQMGIYPLIKPVRILPFLASIGGPRTDADIRDITIVHADGTKDSVDLNKILFHSDMSQNIFLKGGDVVYIPSVKQGDSQVIVLGAIKTPGLYPFHNNLTALGATTLAGSFIRESKPETTLIIRTHNGEPQVLRANLRKLLKKGEKFEDVFLKRGDIVFVPPNTISDYNRCVAHIMPTLRLLESVGTIIIDADVITGIFRREFGHSSDADIAARSNQLAAEQDARTAAEAAAQAAVQSSTTP